MPFLILLSLLSLEVFAQHSQQPVKEDNADLRNTSVLFTLEDLKAERLYWLERTANLDHFLRLKDERNQETLRKVDGRVAKRLDMDFASRFLRSHYEHPTQEGKCELLYRLSMKGESQDICGKDEKKSQEFDAFVKELNKHY